MKNVKKWSGSKSKEREKPSMKLTIYKLVNCGTIWQVDYITQCFMPDEDKSYRKFSKHNNLRLVQIKGGKSVKGIFHIQHLNAYHSKLKAFVSSFKGISSKYLNNYLVWNNVVEHKGGTLREKTANILNFAASALFEETCLAVPMRPSIPLLVKNQS